MARLPGPQSPLLDKQVTRTQGCSGWSRTRGRPGRSQVQPRGSAPRGRACKCTGGSVASCSRRCSV